MTRPDLREVVLVEEDDRDTADRGAAVDVVDRGEDARPQSARGSRPRPGRRRFAVGVVLGLLVTTGVVVDGARERALAARLADVPGLLAPLGPDVQELWRRPAGWGQLATVGGDLVLGREDASGVDELVGIDGATGQEQWVAGIPELSETGEIWCETFGDADLRLTTAVACRVVPSQGREVFGRRLDAPSPRGAALFVVDPRTGERVAERTLDSSYPTLESLGDDLVLVEVQDDGHVRATLTDPLSGQERWSFRSDDPLPTTGRLRETPFPVVRHGVLLLTGSTGWALSADGDLLGEWDLRGAQLPLLGGRPGTDTLTVLPDGRFAVARPGAATAVPGRYGTVSATDSTDGFAIPGPVVQPVVDDGSAADVVVTAKAVDGELTGQDAATGERLWTRPGGIRGDALLLDRRLITVAGDAIVAVEPRTGEPLWSVPLGGQRAPRLLTDGHLVLAGLQGGGTRELVAWGVDDGRERWRAPLPPDAEALRVVGDRLVAFSEEHVFALGSPRAAEAGGDEGGSTGRTAGARLP